MASLVTAAIYALGMLLGALAFHWITRAASAERRRAEAAQLADLQQQLQAALRERNGRDADILSLTSQLASASAEREAFRREAEQKDAHLESLNSDLRSTGAQLQKISADHEALRATLAAEQKAAEERLQDLRAAEARLKDTFHSLAADALKSSTDEFLKLAESRLGESQQAASGDLELRKKEVEQLVTPLRETLQTFQSQVQALEVERKGAYEGITTEVKVMRDIHEVVRAQTGNLVKALSAPQVRGSWGEMQLKRVAELAGMVEHCDFNEQQTHQAEGSALRPDMTVHLPAGRKILVDSKVSLVGYLAAMAAEDDAVRDQKLADHARQVRAHVDGLAGKRYERIEGAPNFVVAFLPGEVFLSAALQQDPTLLEHAAEKNIILATPTTLIAMLKAISVGWREEQLARNAQVIGNLGKEMHDRLATLCGHIEDLRAGLERSNKAYNSMVGSMEKNVLVTARRFTELRGISPDAAEILPPPALVESTPRELNFPARSATTVADAAANAAAAHNSGTADSTSTTDLASRSPRVKRIAASASDAD